MIGSIFSLNDKAGYSQALYHDMVESMVVKLDVLYDQVSSADDGRVLAGAYQMCFSIITVWPEDDFLKAADILSAWNRKTKGE